MSFYPQTYTPSPEKSDYMKLPEGEHRIRILTPPIIGFESWSVDNKPTRKKTYQELVNVESKDGKIKEFHAFIVYDYATEMVRLLNITKKSIQDWLYNQTLDEDWADPTAYDIVIKRTGKGQNDTSYSVTAKLPKPLEDAVIEAFGAVTIDAERYFTGGHPIVRDSSLDSNGGHPVNREKAMTSDDRNALAKEVAEDVPF